jgi:hypothetical protein
MPNVPWTPNTTCSIYHNSGAHQDGIPCFLEANYARHTESGEGDPMDFRYTHTLLLPIGTDVEDTYDAGVQPGGQDIVWIPNYAATSTPYRVQFVETKAWGSAWAHLKVYLDRGTPPWPTSNL